MKLYVKLYSVYDLTASGKFIGRMPYKEAKQLYGDQPDRYLLIHNSLRNHNKRKHRPAVKCLQSGVYVKLHKSEIAHKIVNL